MLPRRMGKWKGLRPQRKGWRTPRSCTSKPDAQRPLPLVARPSRGSSIGPPRPIVELIRARVALLPPKSRGSNSGSARRTWNPIGAMEGFPRSVHGLMKQFRAAAEVRKNETTE